MKLVEFLKDLERKKEPTALYEETIVGGNGMGLFGQALKSLESKLFECDEFKNVVRINFLEFPVFVMDKETEEPISSNREFLGGETKVITTSSFNIKPDQEFKFNKYVDIYGITINKRFNGKQDIDKPGVWIYPKIYNEQTFEPKNQIRVIWDPDKLQDALKLMGSNETPKERIMRMFESALESMEPNIECDYYLSIRCSERSIVIEGDDAKEEAPVAEEPKQMVFPGVTGFVGFTNID